MNVRDLIPFLGYLLQRKNSKLSYLANWQSTPSYWRLGQDWQSFLFRLRQFLFRLRYRQRVQRESFSAFSNILGNLIKPILLTILIVSFLEFSEFVVLTYGHILTPITPQAGLNSVRALRQHIHKDQAIYSTVLSTFIQVSGTFLGLYFAAVSVVISTVYARVQGDVRSLLMRDKVGDRYVAIVAILGAASALLLGLMALGRLPGVLNLIFIVGLGISAIYSFIVLGLRIFYFFDPTKLVDYLTIDLIQWVKEATPAGSFWQDPSFQAHYQSQAEEVLRTYRNIVYLANREEHLQSKALMGLASRAFFLLRYYANEKLSIPSNSQWFKRTYKHPDWFTTPDSSTRLALSAGVALQPTQVPDLMWAEDEIERTVAYTLRGLFERRDLMGAYSFTDHAQQTFKSMARQFAVDEALQLFRAVSPLVREQIHKMKAEIGEQENDLNEVKMALGLTDVYGLGFINILLGLSDRLRETTGESLAKTVAELNWDEPESIYKSELPRSVVEQIENLRIKLDFEKEVEGHLVTPLWYQQQLIALSFIRFIESSVNNLIKDLENVFAVEVESLVADRRDIFAAQLIERGLEACNKFSFHFEAAKECYESLNSLRRIQDVPWPLLEWDKFDQKINAVRERLIIALSQILPGLTKLQRSEQLPDYFGHAYSVLAGDCFSAMADGKETLFSKIFPAFFDAGLGAHGRIFSSSIHEKRLRIAMSAQPLIEVFEISGYALIFTELDSKSFWSEVVKVWDEYFKRVPDDKGAADLLLSLISYKDSTFGIFPRDIIQTTWKQELRRQLEKRGLPSDLFPTYPYSEDENLRNHPSPLIRVLIRSSSMFSDSKAVFIATYFKEKFPDINVESVRGVSSFYGMLEREKRGLSDEE